MIMDTLFLDWEMQEIVFLEQNNRFPRDVFAQIVPEKTPRGFPLTGYRCAVDSPERYAEAQRAVADGEAFGDLRFEDPQSGDLQSGDHESEDPKKGKFRKEG